MLKKLDGGPLYRKFAYACHALVEVQGHIVQRLQPYVGYTACSVKGVHETHSSNYLKILFEREYDPERTF